MGELLSADLVAKAQAGDPDALAAVCEYAYPKVLRYMYYRVGPHVAEDLTSEVFVRMLRHIGQQAGSFAAWLYKIAANVVNDHGRNLRVRREKPLDERVRARRVGADDPARQVGLQVDLREALEKLTDDQRELVTLKFIMGLSNAEIGEVTGRRPEAIRALQFRALGAMRKILEGGGGWS